METVEYKDNSAGLDLISAYTKTPEDAATESLNSDYSDDGAVFTRDGSSKLNATKHGTTTMSLFDYRKSDGTNVQVICNGETIAHSLTTPVDQVINLDDSVYPCTQFFVGLNDEYLVWGNGSDANLKFNGTSWTNLSLPTPTIPTLTDAGAGALVAGDYEYYYTFAVTGTGGIILQESDLSPVKALTIGAARTITVGIAVSTDTQVNARIIYRVSPTSTGVAYRHATVSNNTATSYSDNTATDGTIEAEYDNQPAPKSDVFIEFLGKMYYKDSANPTDILVSKANRPFHTPETTRMILDGSIRAMKKTFNSVIVGTDRSIWSIPSDGDPRRIADGLGILNNRCIDGDTYIYFIGTNFKLYKIAPTVIDQDQLDLSAPLTSLIDPKIKQIGNVDNDTICLKYVNKPNVAKVIISVPIVASTNNTLIILNERQSLIKDKPVWQIWDNHNISALQTFIINGNIELIAGDYNGFLWKLLDDSMTGDGAEDNGTATAGGNTTLTDSTKSWTVNAMAGVNVRIIDGTGAGQVRRVISNTATALTVSAWGTNPDNTSIYTIGGFISYHYTNWKYVLESYEVLKMLWFLWLNASASGNYTIKMILQKDFDESEAGKEYLDVTLQGENTVWGAFIWGSGVWGSRSIFLDRFRKYLRFRSVRIGFYHNLAGQPWKINNFAITAINQGFIFN